MDMRKLYPNNPCLAEEFDRLFSFYNMDSPSPSISPPNIHEEENDWSWNGVEVDAMDEWVPPGRPILKQKKKKIREVALECVFCKNNREEPAYYKNHILKDSNGHIVCPVLKAYTCPICGISGKFAHTIKYCPKNRGGQALTTMGTVKTTRTSTGKRRR